jgi:hypothetical protein
LAIRPTPTILSRRALGIIIHPTKMQDVDDISEPTFTFLVLPARGPPQEELRPGDPDAGEVT